jgi:hypothetical protein
MNHTCECGNHYPATTFKLSKDCFLLVGNCPLCSSANLSLSGNPAISMLHAVTLAELFTNAAFELASVVGIRDPFMLDDELLRTGTQ